MSASPVKALLIAALGVSVGACASVKPLKPGEALTPAERKDAIRRASVWSPTNIPAVDFKKGPQIEHGYANNELVTCVYKEKKMNGQSRKFTCETKPGEDIKVKYGARNAEVFGEVLTTRLFWGLGFAADLMFPVRVRCKGCSNDPKFNPKPIDGASEFDPAAIEVKFPGRAMEVAQDSGWSFSELDDIGPDAPPNSLAQRDGLKLLGAFIQHTDSKASNQRLVCPAGQEQGKTGCRAPVMMIQDLGLTFGESGLLNKAKNSVSFTHWKEVPVWKDPVQCVAELNGSFTGHFKNPKVSEAGRAFLAGLLSQLSDAQLRDLFETARIKERSADPSHDPKKDTPPASVDEWVSLFKAKRSEIVDHHCPA